MCVRLLCLVVRENWVSGEEGQQHRKAPDLLDSGASLRALAPQRVLTSSAFVEQVSPFQSHPPHSPQTSPTDSLAGAHSSLALGSRTEARALRATATVTNREKGENRR